LKPALKEQLTYEGQSNEAFLEPVKAPEKGVFSSAQEREERQIILNSSIFENTQTLHLE